jgi:uncharacterized membrane-anchored protein YitT (DUF2179 family)
MAEANEMHGMMRRLVSRFDLRAALPDFLLLTVGGLLLAVNINLFIAPANLAPGGVFGQRQRCTGKKDREKG